MSCYGWQSPHDLTPFYSGTFLLCLWAPDLDHLAPVTLLSFLFLRQKPACLGLGDSAQPLLLPGSLLL